jgi:hypothetical protein
MLQENLVKVQINILNRPHWKNSYIIQNSTIVEHSAQEHLLIPTLVLTFYFIIGLNTSGHTFPLII